MANPNEDSGKERAPGNKDEYDRGEGKWGDSGRSEDWTDSQRYGERKDWEHESSYGTDWEEGDDKNLWDDTNETGNPANQPNPEALTSGQSGDQDVNVSDPDEQPRQGGSHGSIRADMRVVDRDGNLVGLVKEPREKDFLMNRPAARDVYVPLSACKAGQNEIRLNIRQDEIEHQGWDMPAIIATPMTGGNRGREEQ